MDNTQWTNALTGVINTNLDAKVSSRTACAIWTDLKAVYIDNSLSSRAASSSALLNTEWTTAKSNYLTGPVALEATSQFTTGKVKDIPSLALSGTALSTVDWSPTRASKLDNLDTNINSRMATGTAVTLANNALTNAAISGDAVTRLQSGLAASATALSNQVWTNTLTGNLSLVDTSISSRAASSTALNNTIWTNALTGIISTNLNATITSRAAAANALDATIWTPALTANLNAWTVAKAAFIDAYVSNTAISGTALSNTDWTSARAINLDVPISSRASSSIQASGQLVLDKFVFTVPGSVDSNATVDESALAATIAAAVVSSINGTGSVDWTHTVLDAANAPKANV